MPLSLLSCVTIVASGLGAHARAEDASFELPPAPHDRPRATAVDAHVGFMAPLYDRPLCPSGASCVLESGGGFGVTVMRRFPSGFAVGAGYDVWLLSGRAVYELPTIQVARVRAQLAFRPTRAVHPYIAFGGGVAAFGDVFRIATAGAELEIGAGLEIELTPTIACTTSFQAHGLFLVPYRTHVDEVRRGGSPGLNVLASFVVGLVVFVGR